jgi:hypothetical protein
MVDDSPEEGVNRQERQDKGQARQELRRDEHFLNLGVLGGCFLGALGGKS